MELRHLRYFIAVAEEGSVTVAAEKRLHTAQPSLSRQMRDLEAEVGVPLLLRGPRGVELTTAGRVFLDHARIALLQIEAAQDAARRAAQPAKTSFTVGFLTGYEMDWMPALMAILQDELPTTEVTIVSQQSPDLAAGLMRGKIDLAFLRQERDTPGITYRLLRREPLIALMGADHRLTERAAIRPEDLRGEILVGVPKSNSPALRDVTDLYGARIGVDLTPAHEALNLAMAISLVASTGGISLLPLYARNMLPPTLVSRPIQGAAPEIDLSLGYNEANTTPLLRAVLGRVEDLKFRVEGAGLDPQQLRPLGRVAWRVKLPLHAPHLPLPPGCAEGDGPPPEPSVERVERPHPGFAAFVVGTIEQPAADRRRRHQVEQHHPGLLVLKAGPPQPPQHDHRRADQLAGVGRRDRQPVAVRGAVLRLRRLEGVGLDEDDDVGRGEVLPAHLLGRAGRVDPHRLRQLVRALDRPAERARGDEALAIGRHLLEADAGQALRSSWMVRSMTTEV